MRKPSTAERIAELGARAAAVARPAGPSKYASASQLLAFADTQPQQAAKRRPAKVEPKPALQPASDARLGYVPPRCPACLCAVVERVRPAKAQGMFEPTGDLHCYWCDSAFQPQGTAIKRSWLYLGPVPRKAAGEGA